MQENINKPPPQQTHPVHVDFGKLNEENDCEGFGVCRISMRSEAEPIRRQKCNQAPALLYHSGQEQMTLRFEKTAVRSCVNAKYFSNGQFLMPETVFLGEKLSNRCGFARISFERGTYPILESAYFIDLKISCLLEVVCLAS